MPEYIPLDMADPIWPHFFTVAPLVIVGTREGTGYDMAPKHMAFPMGFENYFGFVCTPDHNTYHNVRKTGEFTVSYLVPDQLLLASISASPRPEELSKSDSIVSALPTEPAKQMDALLISDAYVHLECQLFKMVDDFGNNSLITGKIIAAHVREDYLRVSEQDEFDLVARNPLLAYVADGRFANITTTHNFPYPKNFKR
jgi:flavin reductase (DIM6/NTAB) family NADH-FMN oxidoreductase RutF